MKSKLITVALVLLLAPLSLVGMAACDKDSSQEPAPPSPAPQPSATTKTPTTSNETPEPDAGRRDISDGGYYPGKSTKPM